MYYIILQYSIEDIQRQCYAHKRLYPKQPYYVPIPIPKKGVYAFDPYVDIILDVIQYIHHDPSTSLLQIATGTERRFYEHFGATRNENLNLQLKSQVDRVLWVLEQWTLIKMDFCEEERQRIQHLPIVELFLQGEMYL